MHCGLIGCIAVDTKDLHVLESLAVDARLTAIYLDLSWHLEVVHCHMDCCYVLHQGSPQIGTVHVARRSGC